MLFKIQKFSERCNKAQQFLSYVLSFPDSVEVDVNNARLEFGLMKDDTTDKATDTVDLQLDIKDEYVDSQQGLNGKQRCSTASYVNLRFLPWFLLVEALDCDDNFTELDDFGEIPTMALPDDSNFVINSVMEQVDAKVGDTETSNDDILSKKEDDEFKLE